MSCFITKGHILIWNTITFSWDVDLWQTIWKWVRLIYYNISIRVLRLITKSMSSIFKDQGQGVSLRSPKRALYRTSRFKTVTCHVSEKSLTQYPLQRTQLEWSVAFWTDVFSCVGLCLADPGNKGRRHLGFPCIRKMHILCTVFILETDKWYDNMHFKHCRSVVCVKVIQVSAVQMDSGWGRSIRTNDAGFLIAWGVVLCF